MPRSHDITGWIRLTNRSSGDVPWGLLGGTASLLVMAAAALMPPALRNAMVCPFHQITGLPCPFCGATRTMTAMARFDVLTALATNPLLAAAMIAAILSAPVSMGLLLKGKTLRLTLPPRQDRILRTAAWLVIALQWLFLVMTGI